MNRDSRALDYMQILNTFFLRPKHAAGLIADKRGVVRRYSASQTFGWITLLIMKRNKQSPGARPTRVNIHYFIVSPTVARKSMGTVCLK